MSNEDHPSDYEFVEPGSELRQDWYRKFESFLWKDDRVCRMGRGALAVGVVVMATFNSAMLALVLMKL